MQDQQTLDELRRNLNSLQRQATAALKRGDVAGAVKLQDRVTGLHIQIAEHTHRSLLRAQKQLEPLPVVEHEPFATETAHERNGHAVHRG